MSQSSVLPPAAFYGSSTSPAKIIANIQPKSPGNRTKKQRRSNAQVVTSGVPGSRSGILKLGAVYIAAMAAFFAANLPSLGDPSGYCSPSFEALKQVRVI